MKIVLIGYRGLLGQDLDATLSERPNLELIRFNSETLDIREASCIDTLVSLKADWIVNASAYTAVDAAEELLHGDQRIYRSVEQNSAYPGNPHGEGHRDTQQQRGNKQYD